MGKSQSKLSAAILTELESNTHFDKNELKTWYKGFRKDCPSGVFDRDEFCRVYSSFFPHGNPTEFVDRVFSRFDANRDGTVDFKEFMYGVSVTLKGTVDEKLKWAFEIHDINGDGSISYGEMLEVIRAIDKMTGNSSSGLVHETAEQRVDKIFDQMDRNKDARITFDEYMEGSKQDGSILRALTIQF